MRRPCECWCGCVAPAKTRGQNPPVRACPSCAKKHLRDETRDATELSKSAPGPEGAFDTSRPPGSFDPPQDWPGDHDDDEEAACA